ncbi:Sucrose-6-phosphate hydrolase SacC, GH32 family [Mucilaginibacter pineti]|uniref:Sucrose-6-phosphate hydrolase SacC, GH32 family n=1 Tax=Mucilaginibacter pineti TaxID=1391627 RepID=A0A1G7M469_9SPHI|nr:GH32 C-terminal domain-containing protein [Mucilaginibacter pineti]SDF56451.1 Sucrose-6-phosphate hydrolase SacC, GH32 family [Mucilaginibacter pineti]
MKKYIILSLFPALFIIAWQSAGSFTDAVAAWSLADVNDMTAANSRLNIHGDVQFIPLSANEAEASKLRGGDGIAAKFSGGWLDAGQGNNQELNLSGKNVSILVRVKADQVNGFTPLISKAGNDQSVAYGIALNKIGDETYIESIMGSDEIAGAHTLRYKLPKNDVSKWHDILLRFNGEISQLYVDGFLRDDEVTVGEIRNWNKRPLLIGAQYKNEFGYANVTNDQVDARFEGLIDHVALWNRYLSDNEVEKLSDVTVLKDGKPAYYHETYRPQFHFSAKKNWLNDPNGLVYYDGVYHLFFQYMPANRPGAYKDWGQATSTDLVHWTQVPHHITPHKVWSGCWSGSAIVDSNNTAGLQTGKEKTILAFITNGGDPAAGLGPMCTQCMAYSNDGGNTFTYYDQNPVIRNVYKENRDPKVVWDAVSKKWIMSLFMDKDNDFGLFSSADLKAWKYLSTVSIVGVRECPGFQPLPVDGDNAHQKWLFFGANGDYVIGSFDGTNFKAETKVLRGDYGMNFYAPQTWNNTPDGRCVMIAWMPGQRYPGMPFDQQMSFPTQLTLRTTATGVQAFRLPVSEIKNLHDHAYTWGNKVLNVNQNLFKDLKGKLYDINIEVDLKKSSSLKIGLRNVTLSYDAIKGILSCGGDPVRNGIVPTSRISADVSEINEVNNMGKMALTPVNGKIKLRILLDRNTIEVFGNDGEAVLSSCFMPNADSPSYSIKSDRGVNIVKAAVYSLKSAWGN